LIGARLATSGPPALGRCRQNSTHDDGSAWVATPSRGAAHPDDPSRRDRKSRFASRCSAKVEIVGATNALYRGRNSTRIPGLARHKKRPTDGGQSLEQAVIPETTGSLSFLRDGLSLALPATSGPSTPSTSNQRGPYGGSPAHGTLLLLPKVRDFVDDIGAIERSASAVIRGFRWQLLTSALRAVQLRKGEVLLLEGIEDVDIISPPRYGRPFQITSEQLKLAQERISARSPIAYESIFNFICAFCERFHSSGIGITFRFLTTALARKQRVDTQLTEDLLASWGRLEPTTFSGVIHGLADRYGPSWSGGGDDGNAKRQRLTTAIAYIDTHSAWDSFQKSVEWSLGVDGIESTEANLIETLRLDERVSERINPEHLSHELEALCVQVACMGEVRERVLTRCKVTAALSKAQISRLVTDHRHVTSLAHPPQGHGKVVCVVVRTTNLRTMVALQAVSPSATTELATSLEGELGSSEIYPVDWVGLLTPAPTGFALGALPLSLRSALRKWARLATFVAFVRIDELLEGEHQYPFFAGGLWPALAGAREIGAIEIATSPDTTRADDREALVGYAAQLGVEAHVTDQASDSAEIVLARYVGVVTTARAIGAGCSDGDLYDDLREKVRLIVVRRSDGNKEWFDGDRHPLP